MFIMFESQMMVMGDDDEEEDAAGRREQKLLQALLRFGHCRQRMNGFLQRW